MKFTLPFPASILSDNSRAHWAKRMPYKNALKTASILEGRKNDKPIPNGKIAIEILFYPPHDKWDLLGMCSGLKAGLDGLAQGLKVNDKRFRPILLRDPIVDKENPRVEITFIT